MTGPETIEIVDKICSERGLKKGEFFRRIGLSANTYSNWAKGKQPKVQNLEAIEKEYNIKLADYAKKTPATENGSGVGVTVISERDLRLLEWFRSLPKEKQSAILIAQDAPSELL